MYRNYYCTRFLKYSKFLTGGSSKKIQEVSSSSIPDSTLTVEIFNTTFCVESLTVMVQIYGDAKKKKFTQKNKPMTAVYFYVFSSDLYI